MYQTFFTIAFLILVTLPISSSFSCIKYSKRVHTFLASTSALSTASKYFQLEEDEDKDVCTTEIFLSADGRVELFDTDGPLPCSAYGTWTQNGDRFEMTVARVFGAGKDHTDVGEFKYEVIRKMNGQVSLVGGLVSVQGRMHIQVRYLRS